jgi:hypothetical protein
MKHIKIYIFTLLLVAMLWPSTAFAKDLFDDKVVFGGTFTLETGETHDGSLVVFGGAVTVEPDSIVNGDVVLIGGTVEIGGNVNGNVVGIGGAVRLSKNAVINGDLFTMGATLRREEGAKVNGQIINGTDIPYSFTIPNNSNENGFTLPEPPQVPALSVDTNPVLSIMWFFFRTFMYAALAVLLVMVLPAHVGRVSRAALNQPVITAGAGLLTAFLAPLALIAITITIILIPVTLVAIILLFGAWLLGWVALGLEVGRRIANAVNMEWAPAISAGVGTFILLFVLGGINKAIPCIGWLPQTLVGLWGLGSVLMTRFGTQDYETINRSTIVDVPSSGGASLPEVVVEASDEISSKEDVGSGEAASADQEDPLS